MSFLWITIPATLTLAASLLAWVVYEARSGGLDDLDAPAERAALDDDSVPERPDSLAWREVRDLSP
jgi:nitrogen fixation-related uncharacterized protein